ncbi:hypothetical protein TUM4630_30870 [Shewanella algidipiscicola]|uniref:Uncharacterized protein n=1 Tax=Shewanella algidipiscicola TaxID=614070 RepID=A0ABQ4PP04_9GAMM|nr:hypothetical protein TUM4630_30870 [Shewanella algidipiscicola]
MDALVEFDVKKLVDLFVQGDTLSIRVFMAPVSISFDVQDRLFNEISALKTHCL